MFYTKINILDVTKQVNKNLLDNWYFGNPVNQRGKTLYNTYGYCIDRWILNRGELNCSLPLSLTTATSYDNSVLYQFTEVIIQSTTYTYSVLFNDGMLLSMTHYVEKNDSETRQYFLYSDDNNIFIMLETNVGNYKGRFCCNIYNRIYSPIYPLAAKLEMGTEQTLAYKNSNNDWVLYEIPNYTEELLKCQRYQIFGYLEGVLSYYHDTGLCGVFFPTPTTLAKVPTFVGAGISFVKSGNGEASIVLTNIEIGQLKNNGVYINLRDPSNGFTLGSYFNLDLGNGFDANI